MLNPIVYAVPFFLLLIGLELLVGWYRRQPMATVADSISSIGLGIVSQLTGGFSKVVGIGLYALAYDQLALIHLPSNAVWVWVVGLLLYDFCYYWLHRMGHEVNILWAAHVVHHSSEQYNLSTALRQTSTGFLFGWLFYLPMAILGFPPLVFAVVGLIDLLYQFWVHTRLIGKLGWFDRVFVSPSNHRVHHGQNDYCLDRNYGGILILWDRLFGSFVEERDDEAIVYGIRGQLKSWGPIRANLHVYADLWRDCLLADNWRDRFKVWFMHPGWRPAAAIAKAPKPAYDISQFQRYEPPLPAGLATYGAVQFSLLLALGVHFLAVQPVLSPGLALAYAALVIGSLWVLGLLLENRRSGIWLEYGRLVGLAVLVLVWRQWFGGLSLQGAVLNAAVLWPVGSVAALAWILHRHEQAQPVVA